MRNSVPILVALAAMLMGTPAVRADFTFDIAVDLNNLAPEVDGIEVVCSVCNNNSTKCDAKSGMVAGGSAKHSFAPGVPRTFKGTFTVIAKSLKTPQFDNTATDYVCVWAINANGVSVDPYPSANDPWLRPLPGAPFTPSLSGKIPHSAPAGNPAGPASGAKAQ